MRCNFLVVGLFLLGISVLSGCFPEGTRGCPEEMTVHFSLEDPHDDSSFDSRVGNDVYLSIFKESKLFIIYEIPYEEIKGGNPFIIDKAVGMEGNLELVAWSVSRHVGKEEYIPEWTGGDSPEDMTIGLRPATRSGDKYQPATIRHFTGIISTRERIDEASVHEIAMNVTTCRIEVHVTDLGDTFSSASHLQIELNGTHNQMNMQLLAAGLPATVVTDLTRDEETNRWSTGRFGVFPSKDDQTVSIDILADGELVKNLSVPLENLPKGAISGDLLIFEYTLGQAHFFLTVDGYTQKIVTIGGM